MIRKEVNVFARGAWQLAQVRYAKRRGFPSRKSFVNGRDATKILRHRRKRIALLPVQVVADAHFNFVESVKHVKLGQRNRTEAIDLCGVTCRESIEPAATSWPSG